LAIKALHAQTRFTVWINSGSLVVYSARLSEGRRCQYRLSSVWKGRSRTAGSIIRVLYHWSFAMVDFAWVHSKASQSSKFALHGVPLATALNGCRQTGSPTLSAHNVGNYRPYESNYPGTSNISVMDCTAVLTAPFTHIERKPRASMPAIRAYARRAREAIYFKHLAARNLYALLTTELF
jgi:hypothetical protein